MFLLNHTANTTALLNGLSLHSTMFLLNPVDRKEFAALSVFTFHNVSIKSENKLLERRARVCFTFHNVSIKSVRALRIRMPVSRFTFHNVSIKSLASARPYRNQHPLHSTMFLLNLRAYDLNFCFVLSLHSTMFLLNRAALRGNLQPEKTLHSTMFLLNLLSANIQSAYLHLYIPQCFY